MRAGRRLVPLGFCLETVEEGQHICYLFNDEWERRQVTARYLVAGLREGEKVLCFSDTITPGEMRADLEEMGADLSGREQETTLDAATPAYCPSGLFNTDEMIGLLRQFHATALEQGFKGARGAGEMSWSLAAGHANMEDLMEYEARLNVVLKEVPYTACCQYDVRRFTGEAIMDVMAVHPLIVLRGQLFRNPYYVEPDVFLKEYRERKRRDGAG
jgi:hypothetical protein